LHCTINLKNGTCSGFCQEKTLKVFSLAHCPPGQVLLSGEHFKQDSPAELSLGLPEKPSLAPCGLSRTRAGVGSAFARMADALNELKAESLYHTVRQEMANPTGKTQ